MVKKKKSRIPGFPDKLADKFPESFDSEAEAMDETELRAYVLLCESVIDDTENEMADDDNLAQAKENVKFLSGGYRDVMACQKAKIKYILHIMKNRGYNIRAKSKKDDNQTS